jgi:polar amino acid transport system permease protein
VSCWDTIQAYALRSLGWGERALPTTDFTLCQQATLIGSGMLWNIYFGAVALLAGFFLAVAVALARTSRQAWIRKPADWFVFVFRGSPLFIQFFFGYFLFLSLKQQFPALGLLTSAWLGALIVLFLNTAAYSAEIFHGALKAIPRGDLEAADAYGLSGWTRFRRITFPTMLRLAWPAYTNEAIFLFHATTLVFFTGFPVFCRQDLQPLRPLPHPRGLLHPPDPRHHRPLLAGLAPP